MMKKEDQKTEICNFFLNEFFYQDDFLRFIKDMRDLNLEGITSMISLKLEPLMIDFFQKDKELGECLEEALCNLATYISWNAYLGIYTDKNDHDPFRLSGYEEKKNYLTVENLYNLFEKEKIGFDEVIEIKFIFKKRSPLVVSTALSISGILGAIFKWAKNEKKGAFHKDIGSRLPKTKITDSADLFRDEVAYAIFSTIKKYSVLMSKRVTQREICLFINTFLEIADFPYNYSVENYESTQKRIDRYIRKRTD